MGDNRERETMKVTQLYTYPIKSLRSVALQGSTICPLGFPYDRRFMLCRPHSKDTPPPRNKPHFVDDLEYMTITYYPELALFLQSIDLSAGIVTVTYSPPDGQTKSLDIPLEPMLSSLQPMTTSLHSSTAKAYKMYEEVNAWFSSCFGYDVILAYIGPDDKRPVLGNVSPNAVQGKPKQSWLSSITSGMPDIIGKQKEEVGVAFADFAPYLIITEESLRDVSSRLADGSEADVTKFRPNIVVSGSSKAWDEDYWGAITIHRSDKDVEIILTSNCIRCVSLNVDYSTGKFAKGEQGTVLKKLMKDRRVDEGAKYSPVFGRYGFLEGAGHTISVGDDVRISKVNEERTTFAWPGI